MEPVAMDPYNFFVSQRPAVILSGNEIQTPADTTISKLFAETYGLYDHLSSSNRPCRRYYVSGVTTLRVMWMIRGRAARH